MIDIQLYFTIEYVKQICYEAIIAILFIACIIFIIGKD